MANTSLQCRRELLGYLTSPDGFVANEFRNKSDIICRSGALQFYPKAILCWCLDLKVMFPYHRPPCLCFMTAHD